MLHRPYIRKEVVQQVENMAPRSEDGRFLDANTLKPIDGKYDLGHRPGHEFWRERASAEAAGLSQEEFNAIMNNPSLYQIEDPSNNRSHRFENHAPFSAGPSDAQISGSRSPAETFPANDRQLAGDSPAQNTLPQIGAESAQKATEDAAASTAQDALKGATDAAKAPTGGIT